MQEGETAVVEDTAVVNETAGAGDTAAAVDDPEVARRPRATTAHRVAALFFSVEALFGLYWLATGGELGGTELVGMTIDAGLAFALFVGWDYAIALGLVRTVLGTGLSLLELSTYDLPRPVVYALTALQIAGAAGLLLVLVGRPSQRRLIAGAAVFAVYALGAVALPSLLPGLSAMQLSTSALEGERLPYRLALPGEGWTEVDPGPEVVMGAEVAAHHAALDAFIAVKPQMGISSRTERLEDRAELAIGDLRGRYTDVAELSRTQLASGLLVEVVTREGSEERRFFLGLFLSSGVAYLVEASVPSEREPEAGERLRDAIGAFDPGH